MKQYFSQKSLLTTALLVVLPFSAMNMVNAQVTKGEQKVILGKTCTMLTIKQKTGEDNDYCMTPVSAQEITTQKDPVTIKKYQLLSGDNLTAGHHNAPGNITFIFEEVSTPEGEILNEGELFDIPLGEFGKAPTNIQFKDIGKGNFGYVIESGYNVQGIESGGINIIGEYDGTIFLDYIPTFADDFGYVGDEALAETITYEMQFIKDGGEKIYPIEITLDGKYDGRTYQKKAFLFQFDESLNRYVTPEGYPALF